jgi:hypothetical protein
MARQRVNAEGGSFEKIRLALAEEFDHVLQVKEAVVNGCGGQEEKGLVFADVGERPVAGGRGLASAFDAGVAEVVAFIDDDDYTGPQNSDQPIS